MIYLFVFFVSSLFAGEFGYIEYSTRNVGDDIQAIAAERLLPEDKIPINRDKISQFTWGGAIPTLMNGWYMHPIGYVYREGEGHVREFNWPPAAVIDPLLISMHFTETFLPAVCSEESVRYLLEHAPVGARDYFTLKVLQEHNIPSYFSGCLTLTLEKSTAEKDPIVYAVDVDRECVAFIRSQTTYLVEEIHHEMSKEMSRNPQKRRRYAEALLEKYQKARYVVTSRLHAALPCLAFETPVLLLNVQQDPYRFEGLKELMRNCSREELLQGAVDFDFNDPAPNSPAYLPIREDLRHRVEEWVKTKTS